jgi:hypothetical protein
MDTVKSKIALSNLQRELDDRYRALQNAIAPRPLMNGHERCRRGSWAHPENLVATTGTETEIRLVVADFQTILKEIIR